MFRNKSEFLKKYNARQLGIVEFCKSNEELGLNDKQVQAKLLVDNVVRSSRSLYDNYSFYRNIKHKIGW